MATLIDPSKWPTIDDAQATAASKSFSSMGSSTKKDVEDLNTEWKKLEACYHAPEQQKVLALQEPAVKAAETLNTKFSKASGYLTDYATALKGIKSRLDLMRQEAVDFRAEALKGYDETDYDAILANSAMQYGGDGAAVYVPPENLLPTTKHVTWEHHGPAVAKNNDLVDRLNKILADLSAAEADAGDKINALVDWAALEAKNHKCYANGPFQRYTADQLNTIDAPWGSRGDRVPDGALDNIATSAINWGKGFGETLKDLGGFQSGHFSASDLGSAWWNVGDSIFSLLVLDVDGGVRAIGDALGVPGALDVSDWEQRRFEKGGRFAFGVFGLDFDKFNETGNIDDAFTSWRTNPWGTGTTVGLNILSLFITPEAALPKILGMAGRVVDLAKAADAAGRISELGRFGGMTERLGTTVAKWTASSALVHTLRTGLDDSLVSRVARDVPGAHAPKTPELPHVPDPVPGIPGGRYVDPGVTPHSTQPIVRPGETPGVVKAGTESSAVQKFLNQVGNVSSNLKGRLGELMTRADLRAKGYVILGEDTSILRNKAGDVFRPDYIAYDPKTGEIVVVDSKNGATAGFTQAQLDGYQYAIDHGIVPGSGPKANALRQALRKNELTGVVQADKMLTYDWTRIAPNPDLLKAMQRDLATNPLRGKMDPEILKYLNGLVGQLP